ncbi:hypothetical protein Cgig2_022526 [Carnegiea gigantea]|uniref:Peptidase A1 domain-containing protein n=1 Tax=Carnegiea gigantea TaxID=171969 RepID=A0A9Q1GL81_9CARY|nr:hypothetical protein Cgig2_022526 [Carnegiea gigantea]
MIQSHVRASYQSNRSIDPEQVPRLPVEVKQYGIHVVKISIGTLTNEKPTYKSYYLVMDTGSSLIWLQCEGCKKNNRCFKQEDPPFPSTASQTCRPLQCQDNPKVREPHSCARKFCEYSICYADNSHSKGIIAQEKFTFDVHPRGMETKDIRFGCGVNQPEISFASDYPENQVAGILGLGWAPYALHAQLDPETGSKFSYCLQSQHTAPHESYLKFGSDIAVTSDFQKTQLCKEEYQYWVALKDISIGGRKLQIPKRIVHSHPKNRVILDSGSDSSSLMKPIYQLFEKELVEQLCYDYKTKAVPQQEVYDGLPTISFHLEGANFVIKPAAAFLHDVDKNGKRYFCVLFSPAKGDSTLGASQQTNYRMTLLGIMSFGCGYYMESNGESNTSHGTWEYPKSRTLKQDNQAYHPHKSKLFVQTGCNQVCASFSKLKMHL